MKLSSQEILNKLLNDDKILDAKGQIKFFLGDVDIIVKQKDVVGNIIQEWVEGWLKKNDIEYALNSNTQMPPDFYLNKNDKTKDLLEIKAFNGEATPAFDIADFRMYEEEIIVKPYMVNVDYLIFAYKMENDGTVLIKNIWLKKVWEITRCSKDWALNLQVKANVVHKIRPGKWYGQRSTQFCMFNSLEDFISAVEQTVWQNPKTKDESGTWKNRFVSAYENFYSVKLNIPRWQDIESKYRL